MSACPSRLLILVLVFFFFFTGCGKKQTGPTEPQDTLVLKNGGLIQGKIIQEDNTSLIIRLPEGEVGFAKTEIAEIRKNESLVKDGTGIEVQTIETEESGTFPRLYLKNGNVISGVDLEKEDSTFYIKQAVEGGGIISYGFKKEEIERVAPWAPADAMTGNRDFSNFQNKNSQFLYYKKLPYHILSDASSTDLVIYMNTLRHLYGDFLLTYFDLLDLNIEAKPLAAVIFANENQFRTFGRIPQDSFVIGFYLPKNQILYLYNASETSMMKAYFANSMAAEKYLNQFSGRSGYLDQYIDKIEKDRLRAEGEARSMTQSIIRHEATHQLFHLFGIDTDKVYRGAWFSEGLACYMETEPAGGINPNRIMDLKFDLEKGHQLMPLHYLLKFEAGSGIHKIDPNYSLFGYAQSWAFIYFLMNGPYQKSFFLYIKELISQKSGFNAAQDIALLEKHLGKPLADVEKEFDPFVRGLIKDKVNLEEYESYRLMRL